jgi:hypothetical protein
MPSSEKRQPFYPATQELVILVHGTFANNPSKSRGDHLRWWQEGGDVWSKIDQQLPKQFHVASDAKTEVFSWSGDNSERDRRAGGRELFKHLQKLEKTGVRYHLVGHSHGGSVIWHCLLESVKQRLRRRRNQSDDKLTLPGLRSYTTVGTPFLQLRSLGIVSRLSSWFWFAVLVGVVGMSGLLLLVKQGVLYVTDLSNTFVKLDPVDSELLISILEHPVAATGLGLLTVLTAFMAMVMWAWASAVQLEAASVRQGARIRNQAFVEFGSRWLGIWSRHDEAINGLRASLKLGGHIAPRIEVSGESVFDFDRRMKFYRKFARWFIAPAFNRLVSWPSDRIIWRSVSRGMQGNDRPGCLVSAISPGPIVPRNIEWEQLPEAYDKRLVDQSNQCLIDRSKTLLPQLREVLSQLAWTRPEQISLLLSSETTFEGNELVHTSYFHEAAILELISCHILRHNGAKAPRPDSKSSPARWCRRFRHKARDLACDASLQVAALPLLGQRNLRAWLALFLVPPAWIAAAMALNRSDSSTFSLEAVVGSVLGVLACFLSWSSFHRVKRGARSPWASRWAWRLARASVAAILLGFLL